MKSNITYVELSKRKISNMTSTQDEETNLMAPGATVSSEAAIVVEIGNVDESTVRTVPPARGVTGTLENWNE